MSLVRRTAKIAYTGEFVMNELPNGYDTVVGENRIRLSGGKRQRICIAGALYRDPDVIVFDEATSALDNNTENDVVSTLEGLLGQETVIMIAHRLTTLTNCDVIAMLSDGQIVALGSHDDLIAGVGEFARVATVRT